MKSFLTIISNKVRFYLKHFWNNSKFIIMHLNLFHSISKIRYNKLGFNTFFFTGWVHFTQKIGEEMKTVLKTKLYFLRNICKI